MSTLIGSALLFLSLSVFGQSKFDRIKDKLMNPLKNCPEKIWPGYKPLEKGYFAFTIPSENKSFIIKQDGSVEEVSLSMWGEGGLKDFDFATKDGKKVLVFNLDLSNGGRAINTILHEAFHHFNQDTKDLKFDRSEIMPMDFRARALRALELQHLKDALYYPNKNHLNKAAYLENKIRETKGKDYEANQVWDVIEGSASYVGDMSRAVADLGCQASDEELKNHILRNTKVNIMSDRTTQSYAAGTYSYLIAKMKNLNHVFENMNQSPASLLLADCSPEKEDEDPDLAEEIQELFSNINDVVIEAKNEINRTENFLAIPVNSLQGSFRAMGFYKIEIDGAPVTLQPETHFESSSDLGSMTISGKNIIIGRSVKSCGDEAYYLIPISKLDNLKAENISTTYAFEEKGSIFGKKLWCINSSNQFMDK